MTRGNHCTLKNLTIAIGVFSVIIFFFKQYMNGAVCGSKANVIGKTAIVTGANTGIGKETAMELAKRGAKVIMACRNMEKCGIAQADISYQTGVGLENLRTLHLDLSSFDSIKSFVGLYKASESRLDILVNNAGVMWVPYHETHDGYETHFQVNYLGHFYLTHLLLDKMKESKPARIVHVSSKAHTRFTMDFNNLMNKKDYDDERAYGQSKLAILLFNRQLAKHLQGTNVTTYAVHPGLVRTELLRYSDFLNSFPVKQILDTLTFPLMKSAWYGAQTTICTAIDPTIIYESGKYYSNCKEAAPAPQALDDIAAKKLWDISKQLTKL